MVSASSIAVLTEIDLSPTWLKYSPTRERVKGAMDLDNREQVVITRRHKSQSISVSEGHSLVVDAFTKLVIVVSDLG